MRTHRRWFVIAAIFLGAWLSARWLAGALLAPQTRAAATNDASRTARESRWQPLSGPSSRTSGLSCAIRSADGAPIEHALVCAAWAHDDLFSGARPACTESDASGRYAFTELRRGAYHVTASASGYLSSSPPGAAPIVLAAETKEDAGHRPVARRSTGLWISYPALTKSCLFFGTPTGMQGTMTVSI